MDKISEVIIEVCKIEDESARVKIVTRLLKLKDSGNEMDLLFANIRRSLERDEEWYY